MVNYSAVLINHLQAPQSYVLGHVYLPFYQWRLIQGEIVSNSFYVNNHLVEVVLIGNFF